MDSAIIDIEKGRTSGDGMEQEEIATKVEQTTQTLDSNDKTIRPSLRRRNSSNQENIQSRKSSSSAPPMPGLHSLYRRQDAASRSLAPVIPKGDLIPMAPRLIVSAKKTHSENKKTKPPKFIPYEPYPGAVNSILAAPAGITRSQTPNRQKLTKNNLDIGILVSQMSTIRTQEMYGENLEPRTDSASGDEIRKLKEELTKIKEERDYFQSQFKFQTQVNSELKNLLVASVGEDLQTRVNLLTEDKLQLARALLDTANNLTTHTEQIEFLAGQCEVWRSKFLASSVMVEELARWKADLTQKNEMLYEATKRLLHTTHQLREGQLDILKHLKFLAKIRYLNLPSTDVISLSAENVNILQQMVLHSGVGMPETNLSISSASTSPLCETEKYAVQALEFISQPLMATDEAIRALFGQVQRPCGSIFMQPTQMQDSRLENNVKGYVDDSAH